jgi:hypothetical protein
MIGLAPPTLHSSSLDGSIRAASVLVLDKPDLYPAARAIGFTMFMFTVLTHATQEARTVAKNVTIH